LYYEDVFNNYVKKGGNYLLQTTAKELMLYYGYQNNTGDGILMALDAGGKGSNLDAYPMSS